MRTSGVANGVVVGIVTNNCDAGAGERTRSPARKGDPRLFRNPQIDLNEVQVGNLLI